jgi:hypothetical protein
MARNPYQAHLCAQDPERFESGFQFAHRWVTDLAPRGYAEHIYRVVRDSKGVSFYKTSERAGLQPTPFVEGFMLGVYGIKALEVVDG